MASILYIETRFTLAHQVASAEVWSAVGLLAVLKVPQISPWTISPFLRILPTPFLGLFSSANEQHISCIVLRYREHRYSLFLSSRTFTLKSIFQPRVHSCSKRSVDSRKVVKTIARIVALAEFKARRTGTPYENIMRIGVSKHDAQFNNSRDSFITHSIDHMK